MSFKKILIAIDSSMDADFILEKSDQFMPKEGAQISLMSVVEPLPSFYAEIYFSVETYEVEKNLVNEGIERAKEKLMDLGRLYGIQTNDCHVIQGDVVTKFTNKCIKEFSVKASGNGATANSLSGGNLQKFLVGRELLLEPKLLFLSQPTWGVDVGSANEIRQKLISLRDSGVGILIISEELEELFEITDRMYVLRSGRISTSMKTSEVSPDEIGEYMIGEEREGANNAIAV